MVSDGEERVFKYELDIIGLQHVDLPLNADILHFGEQNGKLCMWAKVNTLEVSKETHHIRIFGTGHPMHYQHNLEHLQTVQMADGLVWHIFRGSM